jgi:hypothetical protein
MSNQEPRSLSWLTTASSIETPPLPRISKNDEAVAIIQIGPFVFICGSCLVEYGAPRKTVIDVARCIVELICGRTSVLSKWCRIWKNVRKNQHTSKRIVRYILEGVLAVLFSSELKPSVWSKVLDEEARKRFLRSVRDRGGSHVDTNSGSCG